MLLRELCKTLFKIALKGENITGKTLFLITSLKLLEKYFDYFSIAEGKF